MKLNLAELKESVDRYWAPRRARMREVLEQHLPVDLRSDAALIESIVQAAERLTIGVHSGWPAGPLRQQHMQRIRQQARRDGADAARRVAASMASLEAAISGLAPMAQADLVARLEARGVCANDLERVLNTLQEVVTGWPAPEPQQPGNVPTAEADVVLGLWEILRAADLPRKTAARIIAHLLVVMELRPTGSVIDALIGSVENTLIRHTPKRKRRSAPALWAPTSKG